MSDELFCFCNGFYYYLPRSYWIRHRVNKFTFDFFLLTIPIFAWEKSLRFIYSELYLKMLLFNIFANFSNFFAFVPASLSLSLPSSTFTSLSSHICPSSSFYASSNIFLPRQLHPSLLLLSTSIVLPLKLWNTCSPQNVSLFFHKKNEKSCKFHKSTKMFWFQFAILIKIVLQFCGFDAHPISFRNGLPVYCVTQM